MVKKKRIGNLCASVCSVCNERSPHVVPRGKKRHERLGDRLTGAKKDLSVQYPNAEREGMLSTRSAADVNLLDRNSSKGDRCARARLHMCRSVPSFTQQSWVLEFIYLTGGGLRFSRSQPPLHSRPIKFQAAGHPKLLAPGRQSIPSYVNLPAFLTTPEPHTDWYYRSCNIPHLFRRRPVLSAQRDPDH